MFYVCSGSAVAWAHVHASSDNAVRGGTAIVTFEVPNESNTGAATTALTVTLPNVASAATEAMPGWTGQARPRRGIRHRALGDLDGRTQRRDPGGPVRTVPDIGATA